jgi:hypothetical protein
MRIGWPPGWNPLPAKGFARLLSKVALAGCSLSVLVHLITLLGFYSKATLNFQLGLFLAIFPMSLPVLFATRRLQSELTARNRFWMFNPRLASKAQKMTLAKTPTWLLRICKALGFYFFAFFVVFAYRTFPNKATELEEVQTFSACAAVFYSAFAAVLTSYAASERPSSPDEI